MPSAIAHGPRLPRSSDLRTWRADWNMGRYGTYVGPVVTDSGLRSIGRDARACPQSADLAR